MVYRPIREVVRIKTFELAHSVSAGALKIGGMRLKKAHFSTEEARVKDIYLTQGIVAIEIEGGETIVVHAGGVGVLAPGETVLGEPVEPESEEPRATKGKAHKLQKAAERSPLNLGGKR